MSTTFARLAPRLQDAIGTRLGWTSLRAVQEEAGGVILDGDNAIVLAPTAGGKTEAAMFPTLSMLLSEPSEGVGALYIAPIKALLNNQADRLGNYTEMVGLGALWLRHRAVVNEYVYTAGAHALCDRLGHRATLAEEQALFPLRNDRSLLGSVCNAGGQMHSHLAA